MNLRTDHSAGQTEDFTCDDAHQLLTWTWGGVTAEARYDVLGNITEKSGQGTYQYDPATDRLSTVGAHAYCYDDNGNALSDGERTLTWTAQNMVRSLQRGGQAWSLLYDADGTPVVRGEAAANTATYSVAPTYELRFDGSEMSEARISVLGGTGRVVPEVFAEHTALEENGLWEHTKKYVHDDHLGSAHLVTDRDGAVESRVMFGPWGGARNGNNWTSSLSESALDELPVGFTGHQPELDAGIINMRGRIYDPAVGRFMSVDPMIENALEVGTWNAYSDVQNRTLSLVDPTGHGAGWDEDIERHEATLTDNGFVGAEYQNVDAYHQQKGFWTPYKAQTHRPRVEDVEEEVKKDGDGKPVEAVAVEHKAAACKTSSDPSSKPYELKKRAKASKVFLDPKMATLSAARMFGGLRPIGVGNLSGALRCSA
ncbi:MAG: RHS repeat domain-containing protein [Nannocystales bacterium]